MKNNTKKTTIVHAALLVSVLFPLPLLTARPVYRTSRPMHPDRFRCKQVHRFARRNLGQRVGDGSDQALIRAALRRAQAATSSSLPWGFVVGQGTNKGQLLAKGYDLLPGDIIRFENAVLLHQGKPVRLGKPHHLVIIDQIKGEQHFVVLHQGWQGKALVQRSSFNLARLQQGSYQIFRPHL